MSFSSDSVPSIDGVTHIHFTEVGCLERMSAIGAVVANVVQVGALIFQRCWQRLMVFRLEYPWDLMGYLSAVRRRYPV
jgi:hypothetical protein